MTIFKYIIAIVAGTIIALVMNMIFGRMIANQKYKNITCTLSVLASIVICVLYVLSTEVKIYTSKTLDFAILTTENKVKELSPEILKLEYETSSITKLTDEISSLKAEISESENQNEEKLLDRIIFSSFLNIITGKTDVFLNSISYFQNENGKISVDTLLQGTKRIVLKKASPYFSIFRALVIVLFFAYLILFVCICAYFKSGKKLYNNSIQFGEENTTTGMENKF